MKVVFWFTLTGVVDATIEILVVAAAPTVTVALGNEFVLVLKLESPEYVAVSVWVPDEVKT